MNTGKTFFAQVMEHVPWKTFARIIERHSGDAGVRTLSCADVFRVMAFAQLTWRESLRDIEVCLASNQGKLFHMGLKSAPARSTLADALNLRDWRIYHALAMRLIARARELYVKEPMSVDLDATVYALELFDVELSGARNQAHCQRVINAPVPQIQGVGQSRACRHALQIHVKQFGLIGGKTNLDVAQGFSPRQLREGHHAKHIGTTQGTHPGIAAVAFDDASERLPWDMLHHLRKKRLANVHALPQVVQTCEHRKSEVARFV